MPVSGCAAERRRGAAHLGEESVGRIVEIEAWLIVRKQNTVQQLFSAFAMEGRLAGEHLCGRRVR